MHLAYGTTGLTLALDPTRWDAEIILPEERPALTDAHAAFRAAAAAPLGTPSFAELGRRVGAGRVCIAIADHTRPVPDHLLLPWIVESLGVRDAQVTVLIGTGTHRGSTEAELARMLGPARARFAVLNHDCTASADLVDCGRSACGGPIHLNRHWVEADLRLATGFIEPHFFAGFSGGAKAIVPGIAGLETVRHFHRASLIAHPRTTWGLTSDNPLQQLTRSMTAVCPPHAIVNVLLNHEKAISHLVVGEMIAAHDAGCAIALREALRPVSRRYPVVVTTNSGAPLDQNFYQTVKGISAAARIVEPGGTIIVASECRVGLPSEGEFATLLADPRDNAALLDAILASPHTPHDQWQVQTLLQCAAQARIILVSALSAADRCLTRTAHADRVEDALALAHADLGPGRHALAVLPQGPLTIPTLVAG